MKSTATEANIQKPIYPYFGKYSDPVDSFIVLFSGERTGIVVDDPGNVHGVGHFSNIWTERLFKRWSGSVTIEG